MVSVAWRDASLLVNGVITNEEPQNTEINYTCNKINDEINFIYSINVIDIDLKPFQKVNEFKDKTLINKDNKSILEDVVNYSNLKILLSRKLNRAI